MSGHEGTTLRQTLRDGGRMVGLDDIEEVYRRDDFSKGWGRSRPSVEASTPISCRRTAIIRRSVARSGWFGETSRSFSERSASTRNLDRVLNSILCHRRIVAEAIRFGRRALPGS